MFLYLYLPLLFFKNKQITKKKKNCCLLCTKPKHSWIFIVLVHLNKFTDRHVSLHS